VYYTHTVEHNYISLSSTVGIQLHVSALSQPEDGQHIGPKHLVVYLLYY